MGRGRLTACWFEGLRFAEGASQAWLVSGCVVALFLGFLLGHVLAGMRLPVPSGTGAMVSSGVRIDPNSRLRVTRIQVRVNLGLWFLVTGAQYQIGIQAGMRA